MTKQEHNKRLNQYPKGSVLLFQMICTNCRLMEKKIIDYFKKEFIQEKELAGNEYFSGDYIHMIDVIYTILKQEQEEQYEEEEYYEEEYYEANNFIETPPITMSPPSPTMPPPSPTMPPPIIDLTESPTLSPPPIIDLTESPTLSPPPIIDLTESPTLSPPPLIDLTESSPKESPPNIIVDYISNIISFTYTSIFTKK
jgi:hypothetical protein